MSCASVGPTSTGAKQSNSPAWERQNSSAEDVAADADMRFYDAAIVWRLPCGAYVWTPADDSRVVSVAGLVPLSQLWIAEAYDRLDREFAVDSIGPQEVLWRDCGDGEWERAE